MANKPKKSPAKKAARSASARKGSAAKLSKKKSVPKSSSKSSSASSKSKSAKASKSVKPSKPVKAAKAPVKSAKPAKVAKSVKPSKVVKAAKPAKSESAKAPARAKKEQFQDAPDYRPEPVAKGPVKLTSFLKQQHTRLVELRDHVLDQMQDVSQGNLRAAPESGGGSAFGQHMGDAGSDAYEKDFALSLLSQEQDSLYEIDEAIKRIEAGTYGVCEMSGKVIPKARLEAIPWARYTVECQSKVEKESKGRNRWNSTPQFMDNTDLAEDEDEESDEEETKPKAAKE